MASNIQFKRGTAAALYGANPILLRGEPGLETDTNKIKYGNGVTPWRDLPYANPALEVVDGGTVVAPAVPAVPGIFTPPTLDGLVLWLDADDADYTHKVNNRVSLWEDLSDTRAQFFQSNKANRPIVENKIADQDVVTFDGTNDAMLGNFKLPVEFTLLVVLRRRGNSTNGKLLTAYSANSATELVLCGTETGNSVGVSDGEDFYATQLITNLVPVVYTLQFTPEGFSTRLNGLNTQADTIASAAAKTVMAIGGDRVDFSANNFGGDVAEIVMYDRILTAADLLDAENYMMERWGVVQVSHPLLEGMKAFWPLNEESGNRVDITDAEFLLTPTGTVGFKAGVISNAANFTGGANYLTAPTGVTLGGSFSVALWFKPAAITGSAPQIIQNWAGGMQGQIVVGFGNEGNETHVAWAYVRTSNSNYRVSAQIDAGRWYHLTLIFDQTNNRLLLYIDGVLVDSATTVGTLMPTTIPLRVGVGEQTNAPNAIAFLMDQLGIWNRALSAADVEMLYNDGLGKESFTAEPYDNNVSLLLHMDKPVNAAGVVDNAGNSLKNNLVAFWKFDDLTDSSGNNHTLKNYGATFTPGKIRNAATFNGYAHLRAAVPQPTTAFTLSAWVKLNSINPGQGALILDSVTGNNWAGGGAQLNVTPDGFVRVGAFWGQVVADGGSPEDASRYFDSTDTIDLGQWCHIAGTFDTANSTFKVYINGVLNNESVISVPAGPFGGNLTNTFGVGSNADGTWGLVNGQIDAAGIWSRVLTADEIAQLYNNGAGNETLAVIDPHFNDVALLLNMNGPGFTDASLNALPVTATNAVISSAQSKFGGASGYFDGSSYLDINDIPALAAEDFTIECWIYPTSIIWWGNFFVNFSTLTFYHSPSGELEFYRGVNHPSGLTITTNQWQHVALVRNGSQFTIYLNGIAGTPTTASLIFSEAGARIGAYTESDFFRGYIDELRITKGVARYTTNFTPPAAEFPVNLAAGLKALWTFDDLTDSSGNGYTLTNSGGVTFEPGKIGNCAYFNGYQQSLILSGLRVATSVGYTLNCWAKFGNINNLTPLFFQAEPFTWCWTPLVILQSQNALVGSNACAEPKADTGENLLHTPADTNWHMYTATYDGNTLNFYVDGQLISSDTFDGAANGIDEWVIRDIYIGSGVQEYYSEKWIDAFGIWSRPLTSNEVSVLYNNGNGIETLNGPEESVAPISTFIDSSKHDHELTAVGDAYLNFTDIKYGNASGEFAGGHCAIPMSPEFAFGTENFTVEFWGKLNYAANSAVFSIAPESKEAGTYLIGFRNDPNMFGFCYDMPNFTFVSADISAYYGVWTHYAFVRLDGVLKMYVNGTQVGTANTAIDLDGGTQTTAVIGRRWVDVDDHYLAGLIDDLRITKGVARYIANFNPPTKAVPDPVLVTPPTPTGDQYAENVTLLLHMDGVNGSTKFTDNSYLKNTVIAHGEAALSIAQSKFGGASLSLSESGGGQAVVVSDPLSLGADDFTVEVWVYPTTQPAPNNEMILISDSIVPGVHNGPSWFLGLIDYNGFNGLSFGWSLYGNYICGLTTNNWLAANEWQHVAVVRSSGVVSIYVNGVAQALQTYNENNTFNQTTNFSPVGISSRFIGGQPDDSAQFIGYLDELRITKGVARYTNNFLPASSSFPSPFDAAGTFAAGARAFWSFNELSGTREDFFYKLPAIEINGPVAASPGVTGSALSIVNGNTSGNGYVKLPAGICDIGSGQKTFSIWFKLAQTNIGYQFILMQGTNRDYTECNPFYIENDGRLNCIFTTVDYTWTNYVPYTGSAAPTAGIWHHAVAVFNGSTCTLYYDGQQTNQQQYFGAIVFSNAEYTLGRYNPHADTLGNFTGEIDALGIWDRALTANEIAQLYNGGQGYEIGSLTPTAVAGCDLWLDAAGDIATSNGAILTWADKSGNGRTATPADYAPAPVVATGAGPNGQNVVRFSGDPNVLDVSYQFNLKNSSGFIVIGQTVAPADCTESRPERVLSFQPVAGFDWQNDDGMVVHHGQNNNFNGTNNLNIYSNGDIATTIAVPCPLEWTLLSYVIDDNGTVRLRRNGTDEDTNTFTGLAAKAGGNLYIGHGGDFTTVCALQGDIAEIVLFDHALGEAALIGLEQEIMRRWHILIT